MNMSNPHDYTVGWICAISTEAVAARVFLDENHDGPEFLSAGDNNVYTLGKLGRHNVVIAVLPEGEYGTASAASVATNMLNSFPNVRMGLMVGIGGGAPGVHDIRLGDIVVSAPRNGYGGVFQYDFGKTIQGQSFEYTRFLNQPPPVLRTAISNLKADYEVEGHRLEENIDNIFKKYPRLRGKYQRPGPGKDELFKTEITHGTVCTVACSNDPSNLIPRIERTEEDDNPAIHYGLIASANQLMKDALVRDKLAAEKDVLCFEMEAAGLMNHFPCLVIRGICDYSDSHKNKTWHGYAAMAAAAYAKDLLCRIPPNKLEAEKKISDILSGLYNVAQEQLNIAKEHNQVAEEQRGVAKELLQAEKEFAKERLSKEEQRCQQLFRLTTSTKDATYEWYKDRVQDRVEGTCQWFLQHDNFQKWLKQESGPLLVSADPGCGKSVLAKYLIDDVLLKLTTLTTICYFFFKDQDQNTVRQALCAILHQLFTHKPSLIKHAIPHFRKDGNSLKRSTILLWEVLRNAAKDPKAGAIIIVLDALDECAESEFAALVREIESQFRSGQSGLVKLKYLLTSRPYEQIVSRFSGLLGVFPNIRILGEAESITISQEVNRVITHRVAELSTKKGLNTDIKDHLEKKLLETTHRTYLWVYLVFDYLESEHFKKTLKGVKSTMATLPKSVNEAYEQILNKSKDHPMVWKSLCIILAASRPLTLLEMNIALNIEHTSQSIYDLDLENNEDFKSRLRSWCGLFVSIHHGQIYFLHQTAREFLLQDLAPSTTITSPPPWYHSITTQDAHSVLANLCVIYLNFFNSDITLQTGANGERHHSVDNYGFLEYSAKSWGDHFRVANIKDNDAILPYALKICNPGLKSYSVWFRIYWKSIYVTDADDYTDLMVASCFGHEAVVKLLLEKGADVEAREGSGETPLCLAANNGHEAVVKLLLEKGADVETCDVDGRTPLCLAACYGYEAMVKLLLENGADVEAIDESFETPLELAKGRHEAVVKLLLEKSIEVVPKDTNYGRKLLSLAAEGGHEAAVKLLLEKGADIETRDATGQTPLSLAARGGHEAAVKLLLEMGSEVESKDKDGRTPLSRAAGNGHQATVELLTEKGAEVESKDKDNRTPLSWAAGNGYGNAAKAIAVVKLLVDRGAEIKLKDKDGRTPLSWAAENGYEAMVELLTEKGAEVESKDKDNRTPLSWAAGNGYRDVANAAAVIHLLADWGAEVESKDKDGRTPLSWAAGTRYEDPAAAVAVIKLLVDRGGAEVESKDKDGRTPLLWAARSGWYENTAKVAIVKLLVDRGAEVESKGKDGRTPLSWAAENGYEAMVELLIENNSKVESKDMDSRTPLSWAARTRHEDPAAAVAVIKLLVDRGGAEVESKDKDGRTPLLWAVRSGSENMTKFTIIEVLLNRGAKVESKDKDGRTPLSWAAENEYWAVVKLLLNWGAKVESKDKDGRTPLSWAPPGNKYRSMVKLLQQYSS